MASLSSHSTPTSSSPSWIYHVFLSFRGGDTRKTFVDHLYSALEKTPLNVYKDDITLPRGETIGPSLFKAIEESQIAVVVFSKNYADSSWCLEELSHIMKCKDKRGLIVMPIFYDVDPSDVRKRKREFGEAFAQQEANNINKSKYWRKALVRAGKIAGWEPKNFADGHEAKLIMEIVDTILKTLPYSSSDVDKGLVGMRDRMDELISQLKIGSSGVRMVGIWGVGGGGKTTLATSVYKAISSQFKGHCLVEDIRDKLNKKSLGKLQKKMLSDVLGRTMEVPTVDDGKRIIESLLCRSNVLVVLDNINNLDQLDALAGSRDWFGSGSRIIITTRDEHLLQKVDEVFRVKLLCHEEAVSLLKKHAYNDKFCIKDYEMLSSRAVSYAAGLPLALKVVGSFLYDKNNDQWISYLDQLESIPALEVMNILKISYEGLEDHHKELFLDIACFFREEETDHLMEIFDAFGFHPVIGMKVLQQKALVTIVDGVFDMHDLIQEMGHHIVRGKDPYNPEKHSRLWKEDEIRKMCFEDATMDNDKIEALVCHRFPSSLYKIVSTMKKLRWLRLEGDDEQHNKGPDFLSNELRCIDWCFYPAESFPDSFKATKLIVLKLEFSQQKQLWNDNKLPLPNLKVLRLRAMDKLLKTPNFDHLPCLQTLSILHCDKLKKIHPSLGNHRKLEHINVEFCYKLRMFPVIEQMGTLKSLTIHGCWKMLEFPGFRRKMESLERLSLVNLPIEVLPSSIGQYCTKLIQLYIYDCERLKSIQFNLDALKHLDEFVCCSTEFIEKTPLQLTETVSCQLPHSLRELNLSFCYFKEGKFPFDIGDFSKLERLDVSGDDFSRLPFSFSQLTQLKILNVSYCHNLEVYPEFPSSLAVFIANGCDKLKSIESCITHCKGLFHVEIVGHTSSILTDGDRLYESMFQGKDNENRCMSLKLKGLEIPKRIVPPIHNGNSCTLLLPENWFDNYCGFLMCAVLTKVYKLENVEITMKQVTDSSTGMDYQGDAVWEESDGDIVTLVKYVPFGSLRHASWWDVTYKQVSFEICCKYKSYWECFPCTGFGVMLIPRRSENSPTEPSTDSSKFSDYEYTPKIDIQQDSKYALVYRISAPYLDEASRKFQLGQEQSRTVWKRRTWVV